MTIKVIKPGTLRTVKYQGICHKCKCEIECDPADIKYEDRPCGDAYVKCPTKGCDGTISPIKITE